MIDFECDAIYAVILNGLKETESDIANQTHNFNEQFVRAAI